MTGLPVEQQLHEEEDLVLKKALITRNMMNRVISFPENLGSSLARKGLILIRMVHPGKNLVSSKGQNGAPTTKMVVFVRNPDRR